MLPTTHFLPAPDANARVTAILDHYLDNETSILKNRTKADFIALNNNLPEDERDEDWEMIPVETSNSDILRLYGQNYVTFLLSAGSTGLHYSGIELYATMFLAVAKRGNISEGFLAKVITGISDDLQYNARLDAEVITLLYKFYGIYVNAANAETILTAWIDDLPASALRLRLTLEQSLGSGMTAFIVIGRAILKYPDFPWPKLNMLTGGELTNFSLAMAAVNGNPYYGFTLNVETL